MVSLVKKLRKSGCEQLISDANRFTDKSKQETFRHKAKHIDLLN
jgi:hypothetical protein